MHKCVRCGRVAISLEEINAGCPCGSKVFIFGKETLAEEATPLSGEPSSTQQQRVATEKIEQQTSQGQNGKAPSATYARMSFTSEDVENIKVLTAGVFALDVNALSRDPMVLKDEEGVYYVKIPFEQVAPGAKENKKGSKKKK